MGLGELCLFCIMGMGVVFVNFRFLGSDDFVMRLMMEHESHSPRE